MLADDLRLLLLRPRCFNPVRNGISVRVDVPKTLIHCRFRCSLSASTAGTFWQRQPESRILVSSDAEPYDEMHLLNQNSLVVSMVMDEESVRHQRKPGPGLEVSGNGEQFYKTELYF